jgi:ribosome maturation factor RimP
VAQEAGAGDLRLADLEKIVASSLAGFSLELVEVERAPRGLLRVFIDRPAGAGLVTVEDCAKVSNQLSHTLTVENIDYERLEVSSPGLDRVLRSGADFLRFQGQPVRVRLNAMVDNRKRFDASVVAVDGDEVSFEILGGDVEGTKKEAGKVVAKGKLGVTSGRSQGDCPARIKVKLGQIEKARLIPQI